MSTSPPLLELVDAGVAFGGREVLSGIDLRIDPGERVALVGPSGSGKTTLLRLLNGTLVVDRGRASALGRDLARTGGAALREVRSRIGFVHQDHSLVPVVRVSHNVLAGQLGRRGSLAALRMMLFPRGEDLERAHAVLERVGLGERLFARTDSLSGGEQQRVAVARALFQEPVALLADEPVASVDPARARDLIELLLELARERGLTLLVSLHDVELAREFFPRTVGLRGGRKVLDGPTEELDPRAYETLFRLADAGGGAGGG